MVVEMALPNEGSYSAWRLERVLVSLLVSASQVVKQFDRLHVSDELYSRGWLQSGEGNAQCACSGSKPGMRNAMKCSQVSNSTSTFRVRAVRKRFLKGLTYPLVSRKHFDRTLRVEHYQVRNHISRQDTISHPYVYERDFERAR